MSQIKNVDTHVIRYAKGHYQRSEDVMDDLRKVYAVRNGVDLEHISDKDIMAMLSHLAFNIVVKDYDCFMFSTLVESFFIPPGLIFPEQVTSMVNVVHRLLLIIRFTTVIERGKEIIPLDPPDPGILPLTNNHIGG